jgi:hypothetical protein
VSTATMLSNVGLSPSMVRQMTIKPVVLQEAAKRGPKPKPPRRHWHPPKGVGVNLDKINAWLDKAAPGDECDRHSLELGNGGQVALLHFVARGKLVPIRAPRYGRYSAPTIYAKV